MKFLLVAYVCYRNSGSSYHIPIGEFETHKEAFQAVRDNGKSLGLNESEDGGGTCFYMVEPENYTERKNRGFWFDTRSFFMSDPELPFDLDKKYTPY